MSGDKEVNTMHFVKTGRLRLGEVAALVSAVCAIVNLLLQLTR